MLLETQGDQSNGSISFSTAMITDGERQFCFAEFGHKFIDQNGDLASLAQILGHENLNTTSIYTKKSQDELARLTEEMRYE